MNNGCSLFIARFARNQHTAQGNLLPAVANCVL